MWQGTRADAGQSANRPKREAMALPAVRARARGGISPSTRSRGLRIFMTARVGRTGSDEQRRDCRVRPDSTGAGSYAGSARRRIALLCNGLQHREVDRGLGRERGDWRHDAVQGGRRVDLGDNRSACWVRWRRSDTCRAGSSHVGQWVKCSATEIHVSVV
jgi:hypothetical protein